MKGLAGLVVGLVGLGAAGPLATVEHAKIELDVIARAIGRRPTWTRRHRNPARTRGRW